MNIHIINIFIIICIKNQRKPRCFDQSPNTSRGDTKSKFSLTEGKNLYKKALLVTYFFRHIMLHIKSLFGNIFVLLLEKFNLMCICHGGTFMLDETQICLCIKKSIKFLHYKIYHIRIMTIQTK